MDTSGILAVCIGALVLAVASFWAHRAWAGSGEHAGCISMIAFVFGWLCVLTTALTGGFLLLRH
jgi:hypothetical protein